MGAQSLTTITLDSKRKEYEEKMVKEGENLILFEHYHLGSPSDVKKLIHLQGLHNAYSSQNCNVKAFIEKQLEPKHKYLDVENERRCEEFDICYNTK